MRHDIMGEFETARELPMSVSDHAVLRRHATPLLSKAGESYYLPPPERLFHYASPYRGPCF